MRIQIEPTGQKMVVDGVTVRAWNGITEDGHPCLVLVHRVVTWSDDGPPPGDGDSNIGQKRHPALRSPPTLHLLVDGLSRMRQCGAPTCGGSSFSDPNRATLRFGLTC